jgi:hypothetical protein
MTPAELMESIKRLEVTLNGDPFHGHRGVVERVYAVERDVEEIKDGMKEFKDFFKKIIWLMTAGVVGAVLNLVLNAKNLSQSHPPTPAAATPDR